jgi:hypothetical protein
MFVISSDAMYRCGFSGVTVPIAIRFNYSTNICPNQKSSWVLVGGKNIVAHPNDNPI